MQDRCVIVEVGESLFFALVNATGVLDEVCCVPGVEIVTSLVDSVFTGFVCMQNWILCGMKI